MLLVIMRLVFCFSVVTFLQSRGLGLSKEREVHTGMREWSIVRVASSEVHKRICTDPGLL